MIICIFLSLRRNFFHLLYDRYFCIATRKTDLRKKCPKYFEFVLNFSVFEQNEIKWLSRIHWQVVSSIKFLSVFYMLFLFANKLYFTAYNVIQIGGTETVTIYDQLAHSFHELSNWRRIWIHESRSKKPNIFLFLSRLIIMCYEREIFI